MVPSSRLAEIAGAGSTLPPSLSVVMDRYLNVALAAIDGFRGTRIASVDMPSGINVERGESLETVLTWSTEREDRHDVYCEIFGGATSPQKIDDAVENLALVRRRKKNFGAKLPIRGAKSMTVAHALAACSRHEVPVKAGVGARFLVRPKDGESHGILNLLTAAAIAFRDSDAYAAVVSALDDDDPSAFRLEDDALLWRDRRFGAATMASVRRELFLAFASYRATEPGELVSEAGAVA